MIVALLVLAVANLAVSVAILRPRLVRAIPAVVVHPAGQERFRVERVTPDGATECAYAGDDGSLALKAWETYVSARHPGSYTFHDQQHPAGHRGQFEVSE